MNRVLRKLIIATISTVLATLITYLIFYKDIDKGVLVLVFIIFALGIFTYGIGVSLLANYFAKKINQKAVKTLIKFLIYLIFGGIFTIFGFIGVYSLIASFCFFITEEIISR
ncbi:hypothetical protein KHA94_22120 [Bacillus sp. FJAT-49705]|uniref:MFS transporter n=1 Tax=Cytobacillus citreus TaxID=2833586 RepID=A0ABS5NZ10_9BACI|nr:hypothetical protein [Cytobacillus citreus]MBS4192831.1 hypothetical protein [Cytobacillus citreus]